MIPRRLPLALWAVFGFAALGSRTLAWTGVDIGTASPFGSTTSSQGTITMVGAGLDYGWSTDQMRFAYLQANGDCSIVARVATLTGGGMYPQQSARAGVMIRESLGGTGRYVSMAVSKIPTTYSAYRQGPADTWSHGQWGTAGTEGAPYWVKVTRMGNQFTTSKSADGVTWTQVQSATMSMGSTSYIGMMVCGGSPTISATATFDHVTTTGVSEWIDDDIGAVGVPGGSSETAGVVTVQGSGTSFWSNTDQVHFRHRKVSGDFTFMARIDQLGGGDATKALAGLMMREVLHPASRYVFVGYDAAGRSVFQHHVGTNDTWSSANTGTPQSPAPRWVKLVRVGDQVTGSVSNNGSAWTDLATAAVSIGTNVELGYLVTSWMNTSLATATFSQVTLTTQPNLPPVVNAGPDQTVAWPATACTQLIGTVSDDGRPPGTTTTQVTWTKVSGPGTVQFTDPNSTATWATFGGTGTYVLRLRASDGNLSGQDDVTVVVNTALITPLQNITTGLTLVDQIDTSLVAPSYQSSVGVSQVALVLGRQARVLPAGPTARAISYVIGANKGLQAGKSYVLSVEYPDDVPRAIFVANRGADYCRGWATGQAFGDSRGQFAEPSVESLSYPQSGTWKEHRQFFSLLNRFQGVTSVRDPVPGCRPYFPANGFHVVIFQTKQEDDPRSAGAAIGKIRLYEVPDATALYARINYPPPEFPKRRIFWREEMADQIIQSAEPSVQAVDSPGQWYTHKMRMARVLGINTFAKDLLEFGYNQGWQTDDQNWMFNAQPPLVDLWSDLVARATAEGMELMPYYEYKSGIGNGATLGNQRRAHKLYHNIHGGREYSQIWWTENSNADLTDPDTLADAKRMMDKTVLKYANTAKFAGVWFRTRLTHLPISFADTTIARFKSENPSDSQAQTATQQTLIASYEASSPTLYNKYLQWWFAKRVAFLSAIQNYLATGLAKPDVQVLFTPWAGEPVPTVHAVGDLYGQPGVVTDDTAWWSAYSGSLPDGWLKWHVYPMSYSSIAAQQLYRSVLSEKLPINDSRNWGLAELFHSAPHADPERYTQVPNVMMTYPIGRLFTVEDPALLDDYRAASGLTVVKHYALNEDNEDPAVTPTPFNKLVGYISVDCDRAGDHLMLQQARAVAKGDPRNIGYLSGSSFSTGFPEVMQKFNRAFLAVPALPSVVLGSASSDAEVVVRQVSTPNSGTYYYVVNTSMNPKANVAIMLPGSGAVVNLVTNEVLGSPGFFLALDPGELRAFRVGP